MEEWASLCKDEDAEGLILSRLDKLGVCAHIKHTVQSKVEDPSVHISDLERTVYTTIDSSGYCQPTSIADILMAIL